MEFGDVSDIDELSMEEEGLNWRNQAGKRKRNGRNMENEGNNNSGDDSRFKSKNLDAERRRRAKLNDRLLMLRTLVPIITNMTKATIIKDAITYIEELSKEVDELTGELLELRETEPKDDIKPIITAKDEAQEMKAWGIQPEVKVITIDEKKIWVKVVFQKRMGGLTKLVEALTKLGLEFNDTNLTTSKGAAVINSCLEGVCGGSPDIEETKELIMSVITSMEMNTMSH
ncbi:transcription factor DYT1-like [Silene latifolia]|uniref:transcription factor DYT1-like n=1 Tax=Silene latifolia TaxID=37657 RepID=UPI003D77C7FE